LSITVTSTPRVAKMEAYSVPMTPAPTTVMVRGSEPRRRMPSELMIVSPSTGTPRGFSGEEPVAMTK
jgi:hypothetical protein